MGKLISTHTEARWTYPGPSSPKVRGAGRRRARLSVDLAAASVDTTADRTGIPNGIRMRRISKRKRG
jgi:hypothetical protein